MYVYIYVNLGEILILTHFKGKYPDLPEASETVVSIWDKCNNSPSWNKDEEAHSGIATPMLIITLGPEAVFIHLVPHFVYIQYNTIYKKLFI